MHRVIKEWNIHERQRERETGEGRKDKKGKKGGGEESTSEGGMKHRGGGGNRRRVKKWNERLNNVGKKE